MTQNDFQLIARVFKNTCEDLSDEDITDPNMITLMENMAQALRNNTLSNLGCDSLRACGHPAYQDYVRKRRAKGDEEKEA